MALKRSRGSKRSDGQSPSAQWDEHSHEPIVHSHRHTHVTHHRRALTGSFEHLLSEHEHEHDHAGLTHSHAAHENVEAEHQDEAHVHDHDQTIKPERAPRTATPTKAAAGKRAGGARKTVKKTAKNAASKTTTRK